MIYPIGFLKTIFRPKDIETTELNDLLSDIKNGTYKTEIDGLRTLLQSDPAQYLSQKSKLPAALLNGEFIRANNDGFIKSNGLFNVDIDGLEGDIEQRKKKLVSAVASIVYCFISPSNKGLKVGIKIDAELIKNDTDFKAYYPQIRSLFDTHNITLDESCKDVARKCFISCDHDIYINYDAPVYKLITPATTVTPQRQNKSLTAPQKRLLVNTQDDCIGKCANLMLQATEGNRHHYRFKAGRLAGGYIAAGLVDQEVILDALLKASDSIADGGVTSDKEIKAIIDGIDDGKKAPIPFDDPTDFGELFLLGGGNSPISYSTQDVRDGTATTHPLTELGNAKRLRDGHGKNSKFIIGTDIFIHWADCKWLIDKDGAGMRNNAAELPEQIYKEGLAYPEQGLKFANWSRTSQSKQTIVNAVSLYKDFEEVRVSPNSIDANKLAIGVNSAREVIELGTGVYRAATQDDYITKSVNATALGNAFEATRWIKFIDEIFGGDAELVDWVQRWCGYLLSGSTQEQIFVFSYGSGSNGKSVFIELIKHIMGDYAKAIQPETLANNQRTAGAATPELAALKGVRLVLATETEEGVQLAESLIKSLTGGDTIVARPLYGAPIEYVPKFKIMLTGNHKPQIRGNDDGIWRRVRLLHFTQKFNKENCDPFLLSTLKAESNHILAWLVDGYSKWQKLGLKDTPKSIEKATAQYRSDQDIVGRWIEERCELDCKAESAGSKLYLSYSSWCDENGLKKCSNVVLSRRLEDRGLVKRHSRNGAVYDGIAVLSPFNVHGQELPYRK